MPQSLVKPSKRPEQPSDLGYYEGILSTKSMSYLISERGRLKDFLKHPRASLSALPAQSGARKFLKQTERKVTAIEVEIGRRLDAKRDADPKGGNETL